MSVIVHVAIPKFYEFEGWRFQYDRNKPFPPWPLKKDFDPKVRAGQKFYDMLGRFLKLSAIQQDEHMVCPE